MKEKTIQTYIDRCNEVIDSKMTRNAYCIAHDLSAGYFCNTWSKIYDEFQYGNIDVDTWNKVAEVQAKLDSSYAIYTQHGKFDEEGNDYTTIDRDEAGKIISYSFRINKKNRRPIIGKFTRDEMELVYRLYTNYGQGLTKKAIVKYFPEYSLEDFKRILSAWNVYKDSSPLPLHIIEEHTQDELLAIQARNKEADFVKKLDKIELQTTKNLLNKIQLENATLKSQLNSLENIKVEFKYEPIKFEPFKGNTNKDIILYLADVHIGAKVCSGTLYDENKIYDETEINRRLDEIIKKVRELGPFGTIYVCLMGDMMDCCGPSNQTSRLDHTLPESMDGYQQVDTYLNIMYRFINNLSVNVKFNKLKLYSVRDGNHTGPFEYIATQAIFNTLSHQGISCTLFKEFFGTFKVHNQTFCISHGKDSTFMKKGMPLNLDDKTRTKMYEWFDSKGITGTGIHMVKADLHSNALSSCMKFDYRNVLSLFGASDYSSFNFNRNSYGMSYDMFIGDNLVRGTFENI